MKSTQLRSAVCAIGLTLLMNSTTLCNVTRKLYPRISQTSIAGKYVYKTHREGKGGVVNEIEISHKGKDLFRVSFSGTYFYMAGADETFHEGSAEGDGRLVGQTLTANLSDGESGRCRITLTFRGSRVTVRVVSTKCGINVSPEGVYTKEPGEASKRETSTRATEVCPDPKAPCHSRMRKFEDFELSFRLPARLKPGPVYSSAPFYAVIVKTYQDEDCDADGYTRSIELERLEIQKTYPSRKVFGSYSCPNMDALVYDFPGRLDPSGERDVVGTFVAVYAGRSSSEANEFLIYVQTLYPQATLKQMTVSYSIIDQ